MIGNNEISLSQAAMNEALGSYLNKEVIKKSIKVIDVSYTPSNSNVAAKFVVSFQPATKDEGKDQGPLIKQ